jgi:UDP-glucose 4-epimerase
MARFLKYDLTKGDPSIIKKVNEVDCLVHLAAYVPKSMRNDDGNKSIETSIKGTYNLLNDFRSKVKKIVFASTLEVYGLPITSPIDETHPTCPLTYYGASKLAAENYISVFSRDNEVKNIILRFSSIYGPGEIYDRAIPNFIKAVIRGEPPIIYGDGSDVRDYLYIEDAVRAIILAIQRDRLGIYNIASGEGISIREIAEKIIRISGKSLKIVFLPRERPLTRIVFDISKASKELSFSPRTSIDEGLAKEFKWYTCNLTTIPSLRQSQKVLILKKKAMID